MEEDAPAGVPEWGVTFGDMMSRLLTFFIMLVSLSEISSEGNIAQFSNPFSSGCGSASPMAKISCVGIGPELPDDRESSGRDSRKLRC
jgi:chemotaxis protein MotB